MKYGMRILLVDIIICLGYIPFLFICFGQELRASERSALLSELLWLLLLLYGGLVMGIYHRYARAGEMGRVTPELLKRLKSLYTDGRPLKGIAEELGVARA